MKRIATIFLAAFASMQFAAAQSIELSPTVIASAGGYSESATGNISLSWTLGEIAVTTLEGTNISLSQGFQQSFLITGIQLNPIKWQILAYPNPTDNELHVKFDLKETTDFLFEIQDVAGKILSQEQYKEVFPGDVITIEMGSYKSGVYFLKVVSTDKQQVRVISIRKR